MQKDRNLVENRIKQLRMTDDRSQYDEVKRELANLFQRYNCNRGKYYLTSDDLFAKITSNFVSIGSHGYRHDRFSLMNYSEQLNSLVENEKCLSKHKKFIKQFAIPFGRSFDWNSDTTNAAKSLGYNLLSAEGGINTDFPITHRIPADNRDIKLSLKLKSIYK